MTPGPAWLRVTEDLRFLLPPGRRSGEVPLTAAVPLRHTVPAAGIPLTEVGELRVPEGPVSAEHRPAPGAVVSVRGVHRPQPVPAWRFLLDVHLGALARRLRLLGLDVTYEREADDDALLIRALAEDRVLLTQDRGLLRRRPLAGGPGPGLPWAPGPARAALVRGTGVAEQVRDVLDRFAPPLAPFTRCPACGGPLVPVAAEAVAHLLQPGTRRTYREFRRCTACGRPYWRGAHAPRLEAAVAAATAPAEAAAREDRPARPAEVPGPSRPGPGAP